MKYSFIMPYFRREKQLHNTLISFLHHYHNRPDYEVILVIDSKNNNNERKRVENITNHFTERGIRIKRINHGFNDTYSPVKLFNFGVAHASGENVIITNPECFHKSNVLAAFDKEVGPRNYPLCACISAANEPETIEQYHQLQYEHEMWYQHTKHNPRNLHWCSAMNKKTYIEIGGFDEKYSGGIAYDDDDFIASVVHHKLSIRPLDNTIVVHQRHPRDFENGEIPNAVTLIRRNRALLKQKWGIDKP